MEKLSELKTVYLIRHRLTQELYSDGNGKPYTSRGGAKIALAQQVKRAEYYLKDSPRPNPIRWKEFYRKFLTRSDWEIVEFRLDEEGAHSV